MFLSPKKKTIVGLDIGSNTVKAVQLDLKDNEISLQTVNELNLTNYGIINEDEFCHTIRDWLEENNWTNTGICTAVPQYLATVNVRDFPVTGDSDQHMASMIDYETQHLSGISEENFINDYHVMPPALGKKNPVLIGICKQSVVEEKVKVINNLGINLSDLTIDSIAVINSLFFLRPDLKHEKSPQMILEIREDSSTGIIIAEGQVLYITSLLGNVEDITKELKQSGNTEEQTDTNEKKLQVQGINDTFFNEIQNLLEQWKNVENNEQTDSSISKLWVCGEGAEISGIEDYLFKHQECPVEIFGPRNQNNGKLMPNMATAYGLAVIGLEKGDINISLCPTDIQWFNRRKKNFRYLVAAGCLIIISMIFYLVSQYVTLSSAKKKNQIIKAKFEKCNALIPKLENTLDKILHHQKMMIPFVVKGNTANRFISAFKEISKVTSQDHFFIYIGDDKTFREGASQVNNKVFTSGLNSSFFNTGSKTELNKGWDSNPNNFILVDKLEEVETIVIVGFTLCHTNNEHYEILKKIQKKLNDSAIFDNVDIISSQELSGRSDILGNWQREVVNNRMLKRQLKLKRFKSFGMRMSFTEKNVKNGDSSK